MIYDSITNRMIISSHVKNLFIIFSVLNLITICAWTNFDLVRPGHWGSSGKYSYIKISGIHDSDNGLTTVDSKFGSSVANIGDLDGDGNIDLAVGAITESAHIMHNKTIAIAAGAIYILFMNSNGTVRSHRKISGSLNGGPILISNDNFGSSVCLWKKNTIAVGAPGTYAGALYILPLYRNGTSKGAILIRGKTSAAAGTKGYGPPPVKYGDSFGASVALIGGRLRIRMR